MRGKIKEYHIHMGKQILTLELEDDFSEEYEKLKDEDLRISIKKWFGKRSVDANSYLHVLLGEIAWHDGRTMDEVKRQMVVEYGTPAEDKDGNKVVVMLPERVKVEDAWAYAKFLYDKWMDGSRYCWYMFYKQTRDMDSREFNKLIEGVVSECKERGIETMTPEEILRWK